MKCLLGLIVQSVSFDTVVDYEPSFTHSSPRVSIDIVQAEPDILCLGARLRRNFRFLPHGRSSRGQRNVNSEHNWHVRETAQFMLAHTIFL